jgi:hypothetical protein
MRRVAIHTDGPTPCPGLRGDFIMDRSLSDSFKNPSAAYRGKPFWAWNGKLEKQEALRQVHIMKQMGFGGFFMHSRTGLVTEYLGEEWFDLINACADEAEKLGMEAWLYDEDRWPSGLAGGLVTQHPEYRARFVQMDTPKRGELAKLWKDDSLLAVFVADVDGLTFRNSERLIKGRIPSASDQRSLLAFRIVEMAPSSFYNGYTYVDTLNPKATDHYIQLTHEAYRKHCGDRLGRSIKGIFTDEPHRGKLMVGDWTPGQSPEGRQIPWTATLPARFRKDFGYDIIARLPEVFLQKDGAAVSQVKWHYVECLQRMFLDNFAIPYSDWCRKNKLQVTGHILHEDSLAAQTAMSGSMMRYYEHMDVPGVDVLTRSNCSYWVVKQLSSAARQLGKPWMLSELYGCTGWDMPFSDHKSGGDWQALFGINLRCQHLSWYTTEGEAKRDFPASFIHHSTWWESYDTVERYFARLGLLLMQGKPACDVLIINPVESVWCQVHQDWAHWLDSNTPWSREMMRSYMDMFHWLSGAQIDFDYGDEEMLSRLASVKGNDSAPSLRVGKAEYRMVIIPRVTTLRTSTLRLLEKFRAAGGTVLFADGIPTHVDAVPSTRPAHLATACSQLPCFERDSLIAAVDNGLKGSAVRVTMADGSPATKIFAQMRRGKDFDVVVLLNTDREKPVRDVTVRLDAQGAVESWNCLHGTKSVVPSSRNGRFLTFTESFAIAGEQVYVIQRKTPRGLTTRRTEKTVSRATWRGPFTYRLSEPNVCVLDWAQHRIDRGRWSRVDEILRADQAVRKQLHLALRGGEMLQPWWVNREQAGKIPTTTRVAFRYTFHIDRVPSTSLELAMERPSAWKVQFNGTTLSSVTATGWWIDTCLQRLPIPPAVLRPGENEIIVETDFHYGTNPEAMFILGAFGVTLDGRDRHIVDLPARLKRGDITTQGLPFYSGSLVYELPAIKTNTKGATEHICLPSFGGTCAKVSVAGCSGVVIPWHPFEADITHLQRADGAGLDVEIITSRRNSFGPLHQYPAESNAVGPNSFLTNGEWFKDKYVLVPSGLLSAPVLEQRR